jgi:tagaturonate reductase
MNLSKNNLESIRLVGSEIPDRKIFELPEKILQFGTGVLLRALPDFFVDKANRIGVFNGRILVVKSTQTGDIESFNNQDGLYTLQIRGSEEGISVDKSLICSSISRVISASHQWTDVLASAANPNLQIVISNTTEVGIHLVKESIFQCPPVSYPAKLLAFLLERCRVFKADPNYGMTIIPTELLTDNGKKLKAILTELAEFNKLDNVFLSWLNNHNRFCSSLVDRIVPGKPSPAIKQELEKRWGYQDELMSICEPYCLWAIEGDETIRNILSFYKADEGVVITNDITKYKELKLRMLNATHTLSCGLGFLSGFETVSTGMEDPVFSSYIKNLMMDEISISIPYSIPAGEINEFGLKVLDRFRNPFLQHHWLSITMQYSSKILTRVLPVLKKYYELFNKPPELISMGFAAYILFMRPVKKESEKYYGTLNNQYYLINDDRASLFYGIWEEGPVDQIGKSVLSNKELWLEDLTQLPGFTDSVVRKLKGFIRYGSLHVIAAYSKGK